MTLAQALENPNVLQTVSLLTAYGFDLRGLAPTQLINEWLRRFSALWIRLAVIEALYLGRYKAISVEHLLQFWAVKGQPNFHFSPEFEQMVSQKLPKSFAPIAVAVAPPPIAVVAPPPVPLVSPGAGGRPPQVPSLVQPPSPRVEKPRRQLSPSIEQFIPMATESDLLSKLQTVLNQGAMAL